MDFKEVLRELRKREGRASWVSAPPVSLFLFSIWHRADSWILGGLDQGSWYDPIASRP